MRYWLRAHTSLPCGAEPHCVIAEHEPYLVLAGQGWTKLRCMAHAGEDPPADLDKAQPRRESNNMAPIQAFIQKLQRPVRDWQKAAAKDE